VYKVLSCTITVTRELREELKLSSKAFSRPINFISASLIETKLTSAVQRVIPLSCARLSGEHRLWRASVVESLHCPPIPVTVMLGAQMDLVALDEKTPGLDV
jgi:hypothetical protein